MGTGRKNTTGYHLLTGATGLLGSYLLRDCLLAGRRMAVLVRPSKSESARQRVETLLRQWELSLETSLPRPVVLEGDLSEIDLGLDNRTLDWIGRHCTSVFHNAASLVFRGDDLDGEPYLSNVEGTRRMLELCRRTGVRQFHHVSTAYVCGLREGRVLESDVEVGQTAGNVYEKTKLQAEMLVRTADFLDPPTIYRPSIIVGDSQTGYTTTYHGFYAPLKLAHTMVSKVARGATAGNLLVESLGIKGDDRKNFVPVDWVSAVMCHIHGRPEFHGTTYHVTSPQPPLILDMASVMQKVVEDLSPLGDPDSSWNLDGEWFAKTFRDQLGIYGAYWRDDPQFDVTNTLRAAPHLPCPNLDREMMSRLSRFAIDGNFGRVRRTKHKPEFDVHSHMRRLSHSHDETREGDLQIAHLGIEVDGPGGGQWELFVRDGRLVAIDDGVSTRSTAVFHVNSATFRSLVHGELSVSQAVQAGHVRIEGNGMDRRRLEAVLQATATAATAEVAIW
ncbi:MAG: SDR family oxidoreductase [Planctomycetota bacterium]